MIDRLYGRATDAPGLEVSCTVDDDQDDGRVDTNLIEQSILEDEQLADGRVVSFRNDSAPFRSAR
jgi:hypothetical protein